MQNGTSQIEVPRHIETKRLVLRPLVEEDAQALWETADASRNTLLPWLPWVNHYRSIDDARATITRWQEEWKARQPLPFGVFDRSTGVHLGGVGFVRLDWSVPCFELGYWLGSAAIGQGFMSEAVAALTTMAFDELGAQRVEIRMDPRNERSRAIPVRLGFVHEGRLRNLRRDDGTLRDRDVFSLTFDDQDALRALASMT